MLRSNIWLAALVLLLLSASASHAIGPWRGGAPSAATNEQEFAGPFASWVNAQTSGACTHATGNGTTDDTAALQSCINALSATAPVLYLPAGTYKITSTLAMGSAACSTTPATGAQYVSIVGADPATTTIIWGGSSGGTMMCLNGVAYSRFDRITFNGNSLAGIAVDQSSIGTGGYFDTGNQYADDVFENVGTGLRCGFYGYGCAETSMLRDHFAGTTADGINMCNQNALDMFVWYSTFTNNATGVSNRCGAGNFHVYDSNFVNSTTADMSIGNAGLFGFYNDYSTGSGVFLQNTGGTNNSIGITLVNDTVLDTASSAPSISSGGLGPFVLLGSTIRSLTAAPTPVVSEGGFAFGDTLSMDNTFTTGTGTCASTAPVDATRCHEVTDQIVARSSINPSAPNLPGTPPNLGRQIFDVGALTGTAIQSEITAAAACGCVNPIVHMPAGTYSVASTITVPAGFPMQIVGDGGDTELNWTGASNGVVMQLMGPSKATLAEFIINDATTGNGIVVTDADQPGSRIFADQANVASATTAGFFSDSLDYTNVELHDFYHDYSSATNAIGLDVVGGAQAAVGNWKGGETNVFSGASGLDYIGYSISNGAHALVRDSWNDFGSGGGHVIAAVTGPDTEFTYVGSALFMGTNPLAAIGSFNGGTAALVDLNLVEGGTGGNADIQVSGNGTGAQVAAVGLVGIDAAPYVDTTSPADTYELLNSQTTFDAPSGQETVQLSEVGSANPTFLAATLGPLMAANPTVILTPTGAGVTDVQMYRVFVENTLIGIHLEH